MVALNQTRLNALADYFGAAQAADMIIRMIDGLAARTAELQAAADLPAARRLAHEIKGLASMYGLDTVAEAAQTIERAACHTSLPDQITVLDRLVNETRRELGTYARGLMTP